MVTALSSTRLIAAQMALQVLQANDPSSQDNGSSMPGSGSSGMSGLPSQSQAALTKLLNSMPSSQTQPTSSDTDTDSTDITSSSFMTLLKQSLEASAKQQGSGGQAQAMLDALDKGTLTVADPTNGVSIKAWDVDSADEKDTTGKDGTKTDTSDWNDFLRAHLDRNSNAALVRNDDGSFVEKTTGNHAFFGQIGSQFYYISWPADSDAPATSAPASDKPASTSSTDA